jgi:hypothetical protein
LGAGTGNGAEEELKFLGQPACRIGHLLRTGCHCLCSPGGLHMVLRL